MMKSSRIYSRRKKQTTFCNDLTLIKFKDIQWGKSTTDQWIRGKHENY